MGIEYKILRQDKKSFNLGKGQWSYILSDLSTYGFNPVVLDVNQLQTDIYAEFESTDYSVEIANKIVNFISCNSVQLVNDTNWDWEEIKEYEEIGTRYTE